MKKTSMRSPLLLLLTATIWGVAFVAQSVGMDYVEPFTFNFVRCIIGGAVLIPCVALLDWLKKRDRAAGRTDKAERSDAVGQAASAPCIDERQTGKRVRRGDRTLLTGGVCCGIALCIASNLQQFGIQYTSVGKAGFITAMYIVLVPVFSIFLDKKAGKRVWLSVLLAVAGLYLLCITDGFSVNFGDFLVLLCAVAFTVHILIIDYFSPRVDGVRMSCIQFFVCGILSGVGMLIFESPSLEAIAQAWLPIGYAGVMSCGVAYTLQIVGQKGMNPTVASLILSLESVVSVLAGWVILGENLSAKELFGCVLMFVAIILAQMPEKRETK
ncbi:MAG: DMT family transporter [Lachnospiraceae bacterium]|nr:DMT family transporter [Lachnospiraceae bacterium]